jgi:hypothetical protein
MLLEWLKNTHFIQSEQSIIIEKINKINGNFFKIIL